MTKLINKSVHLLANTSTRWRTTKPRKSQERKHARTRGLEFTDEKGFK